MFCNNVNIIYDLYYRFDFVHVNACLRIRLTKLLTKLKKLL